MGIQVELEEIQRSSPNGPFKSIGYRPNMELHQLNGFDHSLNLKKTQPDPTQPDPTQPGTNFFSAGSCPVLIKLSGYFPNHLPTWSMMSKMTPSFKSSVRNLQHPPSLQLILCLPKHVRCWSNFQDRPLSNYQHHLWYSTWPNHSSLQSGTINILQAPL